MRRALVAANWKMHGSLALIEELLGDLEGPSSEAAPQVLICPPACYLEAVARATRGRGLLLGAQNLHSAAQGAFTGELAGAMLRELGCSHVLVGHSERRQLFGESDAVVADKFGAALREGLTPVLCIGETLAEREAGDTEAVVTRQLAAITQSHGVDSLEKAVLAYEPVWAIGTGRTASPEQAQEVHAALRKQLPAEIGAGLRILYGGSVKGANAADLFGQRDIDGGLVGGASLDRDDFAAIVAAAGKQ